MDELGQLNTTRPQLRRAFANPLTAEHIRLRDERSFSASENCTVLSDCDQDGRNSPRYMIIGDQPQGDQQDEVEGLVSRDRWVHRFWLWEFLSLFTATIALAAIVITLTLHKDRPLPEWPPLITLNALIAIFSSVLKACLALPIAEGISQLKWLWFRKIRPLGRMEDWDLASRGPWGALQLILKLKGRDLAVFGALLMLAAIAIDPFAQQIIQYYSCSMVVEGSHASVPFSNNYTDGLTDGTTGLPKIDLQMQSAIYIGLLNPPANTSAALSYTCPTGNCTFPSTEDGATYMTLALGSECADISSKVRYSVSTTNYTKTRNRTVAEIWTKASLADYHISLGNHSTGDASAVMQSSYKFQSQFQSSYLYKVAFLMRAAHPRPPTTRAFECTFYPAVHTYSANITNGVLIERLLDSQRMDVLPGRFSGFTLLRMNATISDGRWQDCKSAANGSEEHSIGIYYTPQNFPLVVAYREGIFYLEDISWWRQPCVYSIGHLATLAIETAVYQFLGNETVLFDAWTGKGEGNLWSVNLWRDGNATLNTVQTAMDGLGYAITARWRQGDGISTNAGPLVGTALKNRTCVRVNWFWIALPASLLLLTTTFLVLTIIRTNLDSGLVWKSSALPMLFIGLDEETRQSAGRVTELDEMKAAAASATVQLRETKDGFRLAYPKQD
ncbi:hypothetical protein F5Y14DRAFT_453421 [Nemania sp. NC0429]|nr:hypothetical protein F5Y14DRAFT_453421 [Nemania sp. NC0429]